jgi:hypothetical protein
MSSLLTAQRDEALQLSPFQNRVCTIPEQFNLFLGGGRGGAKSHCLAFIALRHAAQYGERARILYIRQTYKGLSDFEEITRELFGRIYGKGARFNQNEGVWRLPGGGYFELNQLEGPGDYAKFQGRSFSLLLIDEAGQYPTPELLDKLRSNMRGPKGMPIRVCLAANPGDAGHQWLAKRYVFRARPWAPFQEPATSAMFVSAPSSYLDNPFIDAAVYEAQLRASCAADPELLKAWLSGDWSISRGAFFGAVLDEATNAIDPWTPASLTRSRRAHRTPAGNSGVYLQKCGESWRPFLSHDFGISAPSATGLFVESPGATGPDGRWYSRGSIILLDERVTALPGQPSVGLGWPVPKIAEQIREMCDEWGVKPTGVADDAIFARNGVSATASIASEFRKAGVQFIPAHKADRVAGWEILRRLMSDAGKPDVPGLYIARNCSYFWETVPTLPRDPRRQNDLDTRAVDHMADCVRYAVLRRGSSHVGTIPVFKGAGRSSQSSDFGF